MIPVMSNVDRLAGLIIAAILGVALQLAPNAAFAHAGHHHHHTSVQQSAAQTAQSDQAATAQVQRPEFVAVSSSQSIGHASGGCVGCCCGAGLGCCCMTSALAGAVQELPPLDTHAELVTFAVRPLGGVDPEALARPPKSLA